jgi:hypothetical protein
MSFSSTARVISAFVLILFTLEANASDSYQFLGAATYSDIGIADGSGQRFGLSAQAYWEPVKLDGSTPFGSANFYQRVSRVSASVSEQRLSDLAQVRAGRVLKEADSDVKAAHLRLATKHLPVWAELSYMRFDGTDDYSDGLSVDLDSTNAKQYGLGYFITDDTTLSVSYLDADQKGYGLQVSHLYHLQPDMFLEFELAYQELKYNQKQLVVVNNTVRNASIVKEDSDVLAARLSFSPIPALQLSLAYQKQDIDDSSQSNRQLDVMWWFSSHFAVSAYYQDTKYGGYTRRGLAGSNYFIDAQTGLSLSAYF